MINYTDMTKEESKRLCIKIDVLKEKLAILQKAWDKSPESVPLAEIDRCKAELRKAEQVYNNGEGVITDEEAEIRFASLACSQLGTLPFSLFLLPSS